MTLVEAMGIAPLHQLVVVNQLVLVVPVQTPEAPVENTEVLKLTELLQLVLVTATEVMLTTLAAPTVGRLAVVKVPVPGLPAVKDIEAVVEDMVFVPLTL